MKILLLVLVSITACNRQKEMTTEQKAAELSKDKTDAAEKIATGREAEARKDLIEKAKSGN